MQKTGNIDPATGKEEYVFPNGEKIFLDNTEMSKLTGIGAPVNVDLNVGANYTKPPTTLQSSQPAAESPSQLGLVTAGLLGTDLATLEGRNKQVRPATTTPSLVPPPTISAPPPPATRTPPPDMLSQQPTQPTPTDNGMASASESQRTKQDIPKDALKKQDLAFKKAEEAISAKMEAETSLSNATALKAQEEAVISERFLKQEAEKQAREQADIEQRQAQLDAISAEYSGMEIDSNNYWAKKSTGDSILAALAIGLGTFGHVASGAQGESPVLKILQSKIDQDIEIQKANIAKAGNNVTTQKGLFTDVLKRTGDERLARLKTHELGIKSALAQFDQQIAKSNNELVMAKYQQEKAAMEGALAANLVAQADQVVTQTRTAPREAPKPTVGEETYEKEMAKVLIEWGNNRGDSLADIEKLKKASQMLSTASNGKGINISGNYYGRLGDFFKSNDAIGVRDDIRSAAMGALKATLGSQFTQKEGETIMNFSFDNNVDEKENLRRLNQTIQKLETRAAVMNAQHDYFLNNRRSMSGWTGPAVGTNKLTFKDD